MGFVEREILPRYNQFGHSHGMVHVQRVIKNALELVASTGADINMVYVIAAPTTIWVWRGREPSITLREEDVGCRHAPAQMVFGRANKDHEGGGGGSSRIGVARPTQHLWNDCCEADRDLDAETVFARAIEYDLENYPELDKMGQWKRFDSHMEEKYSSNGYIKLWIPNSPNEKRIKNLREIIVDKPRLQQVFERIYTALMDK